MSNEFGVQLSISIPSGEQYEKGDMINIRGANAQEFHKNLTDFMAHCVNLSVEAARDIKAQARVASGLGATAIQQSAQGAPQGSQGGPVDPWSGQPAQAPQSAGNGGWQGQQGSAPQNSGGGNASGIPTEAPPHVGPAPQCSHGTKRFMAKPYKNGKPGYWMAWACPAQRGDNSQHDLEFIRNS